MKSFKFAAGILMGYLLVITQGFAGAAPPDPVGAVPEMDGSGAIIAIGLVVGLVALFREKFFHK